MGKKMKLLPSLLSISKNSPHLKSSSSSSYYWPWPSCHQPRTLSFRATTNNVNDDIFKTINSAYLETSESFFFTTVVDHSPESSRSFLSTASHDDDSTLINQETVIRGLRSSDRLFFEPEQTSSSILDQPNSNNNNNNNNNKAAGTFKDSTSSVVLLSLESRDPCVDFRKSMEEMVEAHGVKDWEGLEELLCSYLRVNGKTNHGYIVGAFIDLLVDLAFASSPASSSSILTNSSSSDSPSTPLSFYSSSMSSIGSTDRVCDSGFDAEKEEEEEEEFDTPASSSLLVLQQVEEEIDEPEDEASCSISSN